MAKAKIKIKVSDSGIVTLAASGDGYATLNALVEVLAATICEACRAGKHRLGSGQKRRSFIHDLYNRHRLRRAKPCQRK